MSSVDLRLPNRSITVADRPFAFPAGFLFTIVIMAAMFGFFLWWQGPGLWRDWQINQNPVRLHNADVLDGECTTRRGLTDCEARLVYDYDQVSYDTHVSIAFLDFSSSDYEVDVVISADKPELATISLGLDMLWNRLAVFAVFMALFGGGFIAMVIAGLKAWSGNRAAATPGRVSVVPVEIAEIKPSGSSKFVSYVDHNKGPKSRRMTRTRMVRGQEPLMAVDENGRVVGVAVKLEHVDVPILLDKGLERLDLSEKEQEVAFAALDAQQATRGEAVFTPAAPVKTKFRPLRALLAVVLILLLFFVGAVGYWVYYVTSAPDAFDSLGMEINNVMPEPINLWGCEQLEARFGDERAPYGCTGDDYVSWKTSAATKTKTK